MTDRLRRRLAEISPGRAGLRTRLLAAGIGGGAHRSERRGSGIEFAGHREYVPGDDLRHLDRHALLRHGRHLIREFHTETERALWLVIDASPSMQFRSDEASESKLGFALLTAAGLFSMARRGGDPIALTSVDGRGAASWPPRTGANHFEGIMSELEDLDAASNAQPNDRAAPAVDFASKLAEVGRRAPRGSTIVVLSDLLEPSGAWASELSRLATARRALVVAQVLDPAEVSFPFRGALRLRDAEGDFIVETEAERVRAGYLEALALHTGRIQAAVGSAGGAFVRLDTRVSLQRAIARLRLAVTGGFDPIDAGPQRAEDGT